MSRRAGARKCVAIQESRPFAPDRPRLLHGRGDRITRRVDPARESTNLLGRSMANSGIRILQLVDLDAGFQARRGAELLARDAGAGFTIITRTIGRGGDYPSLLRAVTYDGSRFPGLVGKRQTGARTG